MLDYRIYTFLTLCDTMNYRVTAEKLNMTQPAVTQHIKFLEQEFGCSLFNYNGKKLTKTKNAVILEEYARTANYNEKALREKILLPPVKKVRMGATKTIGDFVLKEEITQFLKNDNILFSLTVDNTANLLDKLDHNKMDFAILEGIFDKQKYGYRLYRTEPFIGICSKNHPFSGKSVPLSDIFSEMLFIREKGSGTRAIFEQVLLENSFTIEQFNKVACINSLELIKHLVKENIGISFVYEAVAKSSDELSTFTIKNMCITRDFNYVFLNGIDIENLLP